MCVVGQVAGVCEPTGFCSFPDTSCPSGQRYGEFAGEGLGEACVPAGDASGTGGTTGTGGNGGGSTTTTSGGVTSLVTTDPSTTTTDGETGQISGGTGSTTGMIDDTIGASMTIGESSGDSTGEEFPAPPCVDFNFGDANQAGAMIGNADIFGDNFSATCFNPTASDVVFYWVAPFDGTYAFEAVGEAGVEVAGALWTACDGSQIQCNHSSGATSTSRLTADAVAGDAFLYVVNAAGDGGSGFDMTISPED